jgi:hypothetical protein
MSRLVWATVVLSTTVAVCAVSAPAAPAQAAPACARFDVCQYEPNPYYNGPLMPVWEVPSGGWPASPPTMCDPTAYRCYPAVPGSGF